MPNHWCSTNTAARQLIGHDKASRSSEQRRAHQELALGEHALRSILVLAEPPRVACSLEALLEVGLERLARRLGLVEGGLPVRKRKEACVVRHKQLLLLLAQRLPAEDLRVQLQAEGSEVLRSTAQCYI
eukprot:84256-Rhodomonas_salina.3